MKHDVTREGGEGRYRALFELSSEGIWLMDLEEPVPVDLPEEAQVGAFYRHACLTECNRAMAEMYGIDDPADLVGSRLGDLLPRSDPHNYAYLCDFIRSGYRLIGAESHEVDCAGRPKYFVNNLMGMVEDGRLVRVWGTQRDTTEQKALELELRRSEELLRSLGDNLPGALYQAIRPAGGSTHFRYLSAGIERLFGVRSEKAIADPAQLYARILPEDLPGLAAAEDEAVRSGEPFDSIFRFRTDAGEIRWAHSRSAPRFLPDGAVVWDGIIMDVTERQRAEQALALSQAAQREQEELLKLAQRAADAGAWAFELSTGNAWWSEACYDLFGLDPTTFTPTLENWAARVFAEDRERALEAVREAVAEHRDFSCEFRIVHPEKGVRWIWEVAQAQRDAEGRPWRMVGIALDITQRRFAEEALREASRRKDEFLAMLAHELRNPLAPIRAASHVLKLCGWTNPDLLERNREIIERQVENMARLLDDLLDVSRITRGLVELKLEPTDLAQVVRNSLDTAQPLIEARRHGVTLTLPDTPVLIPADRVRLEQVLVNLLTNAAKYTEPGGRIWVEVNAGCARPETASGNGRNVEIRIRDTGRGIPPALLPHVFELFAQGEQGLDRSQGGLGIGLTLVKRLVEMHEGAVEARSGGVGRGSEFIVRLPCGPPLETERETGSRPQKRETPPSGGPNRQARPLRVLVVDDNRDAAETLLELAEIWGYETRAVYDGLSALREVAAFGPEVILLDIGMPGIDGYEVARRIRAKRNGQAPKLVAVTGYGREEDRARAREAGFDEHVTKPVDLEALRELLAALAPVG